MSGLMQFSRPASASTATMSGMYVPVYSAGAASMCALYGNVSALRRMSSSPASMVSHGTPVPDASRSTASPVSVVAAAGSSLTAQQLAEDEAAAVSGLFAVAAGGSPRVHSPADIIGSEEEGQHEMEEEEAVHAAPAAPLGKRPRSARAVGAAVVADTSRDLVGCVRAGIDTQVLTPDMLTQVASTYFFVTPTIRDAMISSAVSRAIAESNMSRDSLGKEVLVSLHTYANRRYRELLRNRTMRDVAGGTGAAVIAAVEAYAERNGMTAGAAAARTAPAPKAAKSGRVALPAGAAVSVRTTHDADAADQPHALAHARMLVEAMLSMAAHQTEGEKLFALFHDRVLRVVQSNHDWSPRARQGVANNRRVFLLCAISARMVPGNGVSLYSQLSELLAPEHKDIFPSFIRDSKGVRTFQQLLDAVARHVGASVQNSVVPAPVLHVAAFPRGDAVETLAPTTSSKRARRAPAGSTGGLGDLLAASAWVGSGAQPAHAEAASEVASVPAAPLACTLPAVTLGATTQQSVTVTMEPHMLQRLLVMLATEGSTTKAVAAPVVSLVHAHV